MDGRVVKRLHVENEEVNGKTISQSLWMRSPTSWTVKSVIQSLSRKRNERKKRGVGTVLYQAGPGYFPSTHHLPCRHCQSTSWTMSAMVRQMVQETETTLDC